MATLTRLLLGSAIAVSQVLGCFSSSNDSALLSALTLIDNGLRALGGETAIAAIETVTYHVPE